MRAWAGLKLVLIFLILLISIVLIIVLVSSDSTEPILSVDKKTIIAASDRRRVIGLGRDGRVEWVRVRWTDGLVETFRNLRRDAYN